MTRVLFHCVVVFSISYTPACVETFVSEQWPASSSICTLSFIACVHDLYMYTVCGGYIQLRDWTQPEQRPRKPTKPLSRSQKEAKSLLFKTKLCWFYCFHPQGCPRPAKDCPYAHGERELRERPKFKDVLDCTEELTSLA